MHSLIRHKGKTSVLALSENKICIKQDYSKNNGSLIFNLKAKPVHTIINTSPPKNWLLLATNRIFLKSFRFLTY